MGETVVCATRTGARLESGLLKEVAGRASIGERANRPRLRARVARLDALLYLLGKDVP